MSKRYKQWLRVGLDENGKTIVKWTDGLFYRRAERQHRENLR